MKDSVLSLFPDTRECSSSLANFFGGPKRILNCTAKKLVTSTASYASNRSPSIGLLRDRATFVEHSPMKSARVTGTAVKQLAPVNFHAQSNIKNVTNMAPTTQSISSFKRNLDLESSKFWESWRITGDIIGKIAWTSFIGCIVLGVLKMLSIKFGHPRISHMLQSCQSRTNNNARMWTFGDRSDAKRYSEMNKTIFSRLKDMTTDFKQNYRHPVGRRKTEKSLLVENFSSLNMASSVAGIATYREQMPLEIAESLLKKWQDIKAEALGPEHQIHILSEILSESMLSKWLDLACAARDKANYWRFVLLKLSVLRADIVLDELGGEAAKVEAVIEEAAELVNESESTKPSYYSTYTVQYLLKKRDNGSWMFCDSTIDSST